MVTSDLLDLVDLLCGGRDLLIRGLHHIHLFSWVFSPETMCPFQLYRWHKGDLSPVVLLHQLESQWEQ